MAYVTALAAQNAQAQRQLLQQRRNAQRKEERRHQKHFRLAQYVMAHSRGNDEMLRSFAHALDDNADQLIDRTSAWYIATPTEQLLALEEKLAVQNSAEAKQIRAFVMQHDLHTWIKAKNERDGIAPTYNAIHERMAMTGTATGGVQNTPKQNASRRKSWVRRFKRRWRLRHGAMNTHDAESTTVAAEKAGHSFKKKPSTPPVFGTDFVPGKRSPGSDRTIIWFKKCARIPGAF